MSKIPFWYTNCQKSAYLASLAHFRPPPPPIEKSWLYATADNEWLWREIHDNEILLANIMRFSFFICYNDVLWLVQLK